jgi:hypothetical protein
MEENRSIIAGGDFLFDFSFAVPYLLNRDDSSTTEPVDVWGRRPCGDQVGLRLNPVVWQGPWHARRTLRARVRHIRGQTSLIGLPVSPGASNPAGGNKRDYHEQETSSPAAAPLFERRMGL